jgi:hypothetical protein
MPGLIRGVARTAAIAGTASAVSGRVQHRQQERWAERGEQVYTHSAAPEPEYAQPQYAAPPPPAPAAGGMSEEAINQLKELAQLKDQGILTEEEFAAQKAKILGG